MSKEHLKILAEQWYTEVKNVEQGYKLLSQHINPPFAKETKKHIEESIRSLVFISSCILRNLERENER